MLFHTWTFALFFLITYLVYLPIRGSRWCIPWLFLASYVFYGWWNPVYLLLILFATTLDFWIGWFLDGSRHRKAWLWVSILANLGYLGFFKYAGFLVENLNALFAGGGLAYRLPEVDILLPVGISFFVFQSMSYTLDVYRGSLKRETSWLRFATFVAFFPQLVAGPIERASNLLGQLVGRREITRTHIADGLSMFLVGLFKKVCIADFLAPYVNQVYGSPGSHGAPALILATFAFGWQIYCDFSGYTDMARGVARLMGFNLMLNFNNPYLATGLGDFWGRWHISLSTWFKDYLYIPLGGSRGGTLRTYLNMSLTMLVSGLWHGANWTFLVWGGLHALGRGVTRELELTAFYDQKVPRLAKQLGVFAFVMLTWVFFRARSVGEAWGILSGMFTREWSDPHFPLLGYLLCFGLWGCQFAYESRLRPWFERAWVRVVMAVGMVLGITFFAGPSGQFIYFQF